MFHFVDKHVMAEAIGLSHHTLKRYRLEGLWAEDIHWIRINSRCIRYNLELIQDWVSNRNDPKLHLKAIELYLGGLACRQGKPSRSGKNVSR
ncbi:MAG: hypothetical protein AAF329_00090 [Cyanobacteria bacterium P01_A01_bin.17]